MRLSWEPFVRSMVRLALRKVRGQRQLHDSNIEVLLENAEIIAIAAEGELQRCIDSNYVFNAQSPAGPPSADDANTLSKEPATISGQLEQELKFATGFAERADSAKDIDIGLNLGKTVVDSLKEFCKKGIDKAPWYAWAGLELFGEAIRIALSLAHKRGRRPQRRKRAP